MEYGFTRIALRYWNLLHGSVKVYPSQKIWRSLQSSFGHFSLKGAKGKNGEMTPFQSIATAIAAQVGTGNLDGAATALFGGGSGAIFWMWVSAFFGMATIYADATLAQQYNTTVGEEVTGGPIIIFMPHLQVNLEKY